MNLAEHLPLIPIFHGLDEEQYLILAARFQDYRAVVGDELIKQGDLINRFFIIDEGVISLHHTDAEGMPLLMGTLGPGRYFGEQMFTTQELANFTADAPNGAKLHLLDRADWDALITQRPDIRQHLDLLQTELHHMTHGVTWLAPGEVIVHFGRKHWIGLVEGVVKPVLFLLVGLGVLAALLFVNPFPIPLPITLDPNWIYGAMALVVLITLLWMLAAWYDFGNDLRIVTNKRVVHIERALIFSEVREEIPIEKIQQVTVQRGNLIQVLLGASNVWIESPASKGIPGQGSALGDVEFEAMHEGERIRQVIEAQRDKVRARLAAEVRARTQGRLARELEHYVRPQVNSNASNNEAAPAKPKLTRRQVIRRAAHQALGQKFVEGDTVTYRKHWIALLNQIKLWFGLLLALIVISVGYFASGSDLIPIPFGIGALILLSIICFSGIAYQWEDWRNDIYRLTPMRVIDIERKPFGMDENSTTTFLENIQDVKYEMPTFIQNQFKFGEVLIYTAGAKEPLVFHTVKEPREIALDIFKRMEAAKIRKAEREEGLRNRQLVDALVAYHRLVARPEEPEPEFKIAAPPPSTLPVDEHGQATIPDLTSQVQLIGNLAPTGRLTIAQTPGAGTSVSVGAYNILMTVKDEGGHEAAGETNLSVVDTLPPQVKCSDSLVIAADDDGAANILNVIPNVRASDNSTPPERLRFEQKPKPGTRVAVGIHALRVTVTDEAGNAAWDEMLFTVVDRTPPRLRAPAQINLVANADHPTVMPNLVPRVEAKDNCTPTNELVWTQAPAPGTPVDPGTALVTFTVKDKAGNLSTAQITLNIVNAPKGMGARLAVFLKRTPLNSAPTGSPNSTAAWRPSARPRSRVQRVIVPDKKSDK